MQARPTPKAILLTAADTDAAAWDLYVSSIATGSFTVKIKADPAASTQGQWSYLVIE